MGVFEIPNPAHRIGNSLQQWHQCILKAFSLRRRGGLSPLLHPSRVSLSMRHLESQTPEGTGVERSGTRGLGFYLPQHSKTITMKKKTSLILILAFSRMTGALILTFHLKVPEKSNRLVQSCYITLQ